MLVCTMRLTCDKAPLLEVEVETVGGTYGVENVDTGAPRHLVPDMSGDSRYADGGKGAEQEIGNSIPKLETHSKKICSYVIFSPSAVSYSPTLDP